MLTRPTLPSVNLRPLKKLFAKLKRFNQKVVNFGTTNIDEHPLRSFGIILGLIFLAILLSNFLSKPQVDDTKAVEHAKEVHIYSIGTAPKVTLQGQIEKSGVIPIIAQTSGVVQQLFLGEGEQVQRGGWLVSLSTTYQGSSAPNLQRQIAQAQYDNIVQTFDDQMSIINTSRSVATASAQNAQNLQEITDQSVSATQDLINLNNTILTSLNQNLENLKATNVNGSNDALILSTQQIIAGVTAGQNQAQAALRNAEYQSDQDEPPGQVPQFQKDIALKQLTIQEKALTLSKEMSRLQLRLAQVSESLMFPSSPFEGIVQKLFVKEGLLVSPGTQIAVISSSGGKTAKVTVFVPKDIASRVSKLEPSVLHLGQKSVELTPLFVSTEAVSGNLYAITYVLPESLTPGLTDKAYITVDIPVGYAGTLSADPFIPIDAVYQSPESAYIYIVNNGKAQVKLISLGQIFGSFVEVSSGLTRGDKIILNRTVIAGDKVQVAN